MVLSIDRLYFERRIAQVQALQQRELAAAGEKNDDQSKDKQPTPEQLAQAAAKLNEQQSKQTNTPDGGNKIDAYQKQKELLQKKLLLTEGLVGGVSVLKRVLPYAMTLLSAHWALLPTLCQ